MAACGLALSAAPPLSSTPANSFLTAIEILPEWYLYPTFSLLRAFPSKIAGIVSVLGLFVGIAAAPFAGELGAAYLQNPWSRAASSSPSIFLAETALGLGGGASLSVREVEWWV
jgi:cytochrome b6-f complex subunit 4